MAAVPGDAPQRFQLAPKLLILTIVVVFIGLPINHIFYYSLLAISVIALAISRVTPQREYWAPAVLIVLAALAGKILVDVPRIEEGHNVFLTGGTNNALMSDLPPGVYRAMTDEFDRAYPEAVRCAPKTPWCWQDSQRPNRAYAFSFDGLYDKPAYSRHVTGIDFANAEWQRLGFVNEIAYHWYTKAKDSDVSRGHRRRGVTALLHPWQIAMPHFVMYRFPAAFAGSQLCWRGTVLWEGPGESFSALPHTDFACRTLESTDAGKRIFGLAMSSNSLAMTLKPTREIRLLQFYHPVLALAVVASLVLLLLRFHTRQLVLPLTLVALSLAVITISDSTLLGGLRPFDAGDDGLVYDGWSRIMVQQLLSGDVIGALMGNEPVFFFTPGSRYLRSVEHLIFGETYFGYVSLLLLLPFLVFWLFRQYFAARPAVAITLVFIALPVGALFGSTFYIYVKHAAHGYGDPAAAVLFLSGILALIGHSRRGPSGRFAPAFGAALLLALAVCVRPNLAIGAAVLLGGAGFAALWQAQGWRLAGLCIGFLPVFSMALHNWYYGGVFVLFSSHTQNAAAMPMPPQAYVAAMWELFRLDFAGSDLARGALQIRRMLVGPSESVAMVPLHAAALLIVVRVLLSRRYEGWLRLIAATTLGLYTPGLFFIYSDRYAILAWLLTLLICCVWMRDEALPWLKRRFPRLTQGVAHHPLVASLTRRLDGFARAAGMISTAARVPPISAASAAS